MSAADVGSMRGQVEVLRAQIDSMQDVLLERTRSLAGLQVRITRSTASARSSDGCVDIVVDASGAVVGVTLSGSSYGKHSAAALGNLILATATSAAEDMRRQVVEMTKPFTEAARIDLPDLVPGVLGLREILEPRPTSVPVSSDERWDRTVLRSSGNV
ncbi:YbaB/EbfC family nucleoid-associated protein [Rhodococcus erythropolis]|uniref:YbaB/EbfC family nucleoid-associated protein n=1 Tax=Rhodococcus erythropolis TaxID=1833 RepID=UPI001E3759D5|nr:MULTISPECIES: YbaB/EbfC family nucleoid-associated protein [Rhodococcus erythropolis group]MCD2108707.1 YbaB/EbfC family nucleoid-associated protein [Rhodococcus qingshengii]MCZ4527744.1 YbaB/EbfC family nucleoid-associated protein [Rhodococcus erythropolis]